MSGLTGTLHARAHLDALTGGIEELRRAAPRLESWGASLAETLGDGGRLLCVGNGGSAAEAQHLTSELVGRFRAERAPLSALCLSAESSSLTAIANDYGFAEAFARQVRGHGRPGDVLLALSTSGQSPNVLAAVEAARELELRTLALSGPAPNRLAECVDDAICLAGATAATVQELHLVAIHLLCDAVDRRLADAAPAARRPQVARR